MPARRFTVMDKSITEAEKAGLLKPIYDYMDIRAKYVEYRYHYGRVYDTKQVYPIEQHLRRLESRSLRKLREIFDIIENLSCDERRIILKTSVFERDCVNDLIAKLDSSIYAWFRFGRTINGEERFDVFRQAYTDVLKK